MSDEYRVVVKVYEAYGSKAIRDRAVYVIADTQDRAARKAESKLRREYPDTWQYGLSVENVEFIAHQCGFWEMEQDERASQTP